MMIPVESSPTAPRSWRRPLWRAPMTLQLESDAASSAPSSARKSVSVARSLTSGRPPQLLQAGARRLRQVTDHPPTMSLGWKALSVAPAKKATAV